MDLKNFNLAPLYKLDKEWALLTAGEKDKFNTMTISWGGFGTLWHKPVVTVYVKPTRYTYEFMENSEYFTISFYDEKYKNDLSILGSKSGRDISKISLTNLTPEFLNNSISFKESKLTLVCKKIYFQDLDINNININQSELDRFYKIEPVHRMYIGEVIDIIDRRIIMKNKTVINALSHVLGSDIHEVYKAKRKKENKKINSRIKKTKDEVWKASHGTDEIDILNCTFEELPLDWQYENIEAARVAIELVFNKTIAEESILEEEVEQMASIIHDEWLKRNNWVFDSNDGNPELAHPYAQLSKEEQDKDKIQLSLAQAKVQDYIAGKIDIEAICEKYNLPT